MDGRRKTKNCHHFGGDHNVKTALTWIAVCRAAQCHGNLPQRAIIHVKHALPGHSAHINAQRVAMMNMVVEQRGQQIVRERNGAEIAGEMQVDVLHRDDLRIATARRTALHTKHRAKAGFAKAHNRLLTGALQHVI